MKAKSVFTLGFAVALSIVSLCAAAEIKCSADSFGNITCSDGDGNISRGSIDAFGNSTWQESNGSITRGKTDSFGNTIFYDGNGNATQSCTDSFGNLTCL